jgi:hypothetical protein
MHVAVARCVCSKTKNVYIHEKDAHDNIGVINVIYVYLGIRKI